MALEEIRKALIGNRLYRRHYEKRRDLGVIADVQEERIVCWSLFLVKVDMDALAHIFSREHIQTLCLRGEVECQSAWNEFYGLENK